ncbi:hypothetical protein ACX80V_17155 [Arthrobacter sp. MDT3-24]
MISGLGQQFAGLQNLPLRKPAAGPAKPLVATLAQRAAAERLGRVFELTAARGGLPLNRNVIPTAAANAVLPVAVLAALGSVLGSDGFRPQTGKTNRYALYKADYDAVMPLLETAVRTWTNGTLTAELEQLSTLFWNLQRTQTAADLHRRAFDVSRAGGYGPSDLEISIAYGNPRLRQKSDHLYYDPSLDKMIYRYGPPRPEANLQQLIRNRLAPLVRRELDETLSTMFVHPRGTDILSEYSVGPEAGTRCASWHVGAAHDAVLRLRKELTDPDNANAVWRYPGLVLGGVASLGLHDLPGFPEYAVAVGQVLAASRAEPLVGAAGVALFAVGLVLTGPVGLLVFATADLAVAGAATALAFLREREHDLAAVALSFRPEDQRLATPTTYTDALLAGAGALLSGIAFFQAAVSFGKLTRIRPSGVTETLTRRAEAIRVRTDPPKQDPTATTARQIGDKLLDRSAAASRQARAVERGPAEEITVTGRGTATEAAAAQAPTPASADPRGTLPARSARPPDVEPRQVPSEANREHASLGRSTVDTEPPTEVELGRQIDSARGTGPREPTIRELRIKERQDFREAQQAKLEALIQKIRLDSGLKTDYQRELRRIEDAVKSARRAGRIEEEAVLRARRDVVKELQDELASHADEWLRIKSSLTQLTAEHYAAITAEAATRPSWAAVRDGAPSPLFLPLRSGGKYSVEHVWPRSQMFLEPEFLSLNWDQQVAMFANSDNLLKIPLDANIARGNRAYRTLPGSFARTYLVNPAALTELTRLEVEAQVLMLRLLKNRGRIR